MWRGHRGRRGNRWPLSSSLEPLGVVARRTAIDITIAAVNSELQRHRLNFPSRMPPSLHSLSLRLTNDEHSCVPAVFFGLKKSLDSFVCEGSIEKEWNCFLTRASQEKLMASTFEGSDEYVRAKALTTL